jgi:glycosyltransferase involved in cell wall biosynthesis
MLSEMLSAMPPKTPYRVLINAMHTTTGGGLSYLAGILPELAKDARFEWHLIAPQITLGQLEVPVDVKVHVGPRLGFMKSHLWEQFTLPLMARRWGMQAVLCNANYTPLLAPNPVPIIHTTLKAARSFKTWKMRIYWVFFKAMTQFALVRAPVAFSVARHAVAEYDKSHAVARKMRIAPPAVRPVDMTTEVKRDPNLVVTVGDYYPQKDYPTLLKAFKILHTQRPATRLLIIGKAVDVNVARLMKETIAELDLQRAVTLAGSVQYPLLVQALRQASVYVSTSEAECFNMPVLEAMACGVPCVLPDVDFQREVADKAALYVPVEKGGDIASAFAVALYGVLENPSVAHMFCRAGQERVALFTWAATARIVTDAFSKVFGK